MNYAEWVAAHPAPPPEKKPRSFELNYSRLKAYLDCPWLHKLRYVDGWRQPPSPQASMGMTVHKALEAYHRKGGDALDALLEAYDRHFHHGGFADRADKAQWYKKGESVLKGHWKREQARRTNVLYCEREFFFELGPHTVRGMIDRVDEHPDGRVEIIDYKTGLEPLTPEELKDDLQLSMYGLGAREGLGLEPAILTLDYVSLGERVSVPYDPGKDGDLKAFLRRAADLMATGAAKADTAFCPRCMFRASCALSVAKD